MQQANEFLFKLCSGRHALIGPHKPSYFSRGLTSHRPTKTAIEIRYLLIRLLSSSCPVRSSSIIQPIVYILQQFNASQYFSLWLPALALMILDSGADTGGPPPPSPQKKKKREREIEKRKERKWRGNM